VGVTTFHDHSQPWPFPVLYHGSFDLQ
jgi:hypothetical protein